MVKIGSKEYARYPFLEGAGKHMASRGYAIEQFGDNPDLVPIIKRAMRRIEAAANGPAYTSELDFAKQNSGTLDRETFSFLLAAVLLKASGAKSLVRRFALSEALRAETFLARSLKHSSDKDVPAEILAELFSVRVEHDELGYKISVTSYVRRSVHFHASVWKLVNRMVHGGMVYLTADQVVRLVREEIVDHIVERIRQSPPAPVLPTFQDPVKRIQELSKDLDPKYTIVTGEHPPCVKHAIEVLKQGENLSHSGRFMLATFLLGRGWSVEKIAPLFKGAPDYSEQTTMYQLNNISGSGGGTKYSCPLCDKLRTQNLCFETSECAGIISPMQFGRRREK